MYEILFNIFSHQGNTNKNYIEISFHTSQNAIRKRKMLTGIVWRGRKNPYALLKGTNSATTMENSVEIPEKAKIRATI
jgi:hypothetical protein